MELFEKKDAVAKTLDKTGGPPATRLREEDAGWIQTFTGRKFFPLSPRSQDVVIEDIAHALAMKCRFAGHCQRFYSVAQHSVLVSGQLDVGKLLPAGGSETNTRRQMLGLLHDAAEAYLPDVARPIKAGLAGFEVIESAVLAAIYVGLGLGDLAREAGEADSGMARVLKHADLVLLNTEARDLMGKAPERWSTACLAEPQAKVIDPWGPLVAEKVFLDRYRYLKEGLISASGGSAPR